MTCASCGAGVPDGARFCMSCGAPVAAAAALESRKVVTAVFCDVAGSTALGDARDPEALRSVMTRWFAAMRTVLERHGGTVEKFIGDAVMAVFGVPVVHEDDALRAVRAAVEMQAAVERLDDELERAFGVRLAIRVGVNTGEVVTGDGTSGTVATGDAINVAARLEQAAGPGEVLIGAATHELVRGAVDAVPVVDLVVKGKTLPLKAFRVSRVSNEPRAVTQDVPLVGREREVAQLCAVLDDAATSRSCRLVTVLGTPGVGKTRLVSDVLDDLPEVRLLRGRCPSYGDTDGLQPLAELVRAAAATAGATPAADHVVETVAALAGADVAARLAPLVGTGSPASPDDVLWAVRRLVEALATDRPVVVLVDDVHWASPLLLDVLDHLADWVVDSPVTVVAVARPELLETRPSWAAGKAAATTLVLQPLDAVGADELTSALLAGTAVPAEVRDRILAAADGMPLFVEQMVAMVAGNLGSPVTVPPTIQALLAARLEQLDADERSVLGAAAVMGQVFPRAGLAALTGRTGLTATIATLVRKDFLRPARSVLPGEDAIAFRHVLLRDAAYATLAKATRASLHERFARWLDARGDDTDRSAVHYLREAVRLRDELGPRDAATELLAGETVDRLLDLARRQLDLDGAAAGRTFDDAAALTTDPRVRGQVLLERSFTAASNPLETVLGERAAAAALRCAEEAGDERLARIAWLRVVGLSSDPVDAAVVERVRAELDRFAADRDDEGVAAALSCLGLFANLWAAWDDLLPISRRLRASAERLGNRQLARAASEMILGAALFGSQPIPEALDELAEIGRRTRGTRGALRALGATYALLLQVGRDDEAAAALEERDRVAREAGVTASGVEDAFQIGMAAAHLGRWQEARTIFDRGVDELVTAGERSMASTLFAFRGQARAALGDLDGALADARAARDLGSADDVCTQAAARVAEVRVGIARGADVVDLAREAVAIAERGHGVDDRSEAQLALARALRSAGREDEAQVQYDGVVALLTRRGSTVRAAAAAAERDGRARPPLDRGDGTVTP